MSTEDLRHYITYLPAHRVVTCRFCMICIPPENPMRHYADHHTAKKEHPVPMNIRHKIVEYMGTVDLCAPDEVISPSILIPELKIITEKGYVCNFAGCGKCATTEGSMVTHYYEHQAHIPKGFKDWEETALQTFFDGKHKR